MPPPCLLKICYLGVAEGSPSPPRVTSPRGSKGPLCVMFNLNSCLGRQIPHDMDRSFHHARNYYWVRPLSCLS